MANEACLSTVDRGRRCCYLPRQVATTRARQQAELSVIREAHVCALSELMNLNSSKHLKFQKGAKNKDFLKEVNMS